MGQSHFVNAIEVEGLVKTFPGGIEAVAGIDLVVGESEIVGFLGPNGAGKSTTSRILTTLLRPTAGRARVAGLDVVHHAAEVRRVIGVALQEAGLDRLATGREMLVLQSRLHGMHGAEAQRRAEEVLEIVGLSDAADRLIRTYSGGMKRRLDLASALVHRPRVLFLDEPTTGLDVTSRHAIWDEVRRLNEQDGIPVFLTTQYLEEADRVVERVAIIDHGRIVAEGTPDELKASIGSDVVTVELPDGRPEEARAALAPLAGLRDVRVEPSGLTLFVNDGSGAVASALRLLDDARVPVGAVAVSRPTLDEVFLRATGSRLEGASPAGAASEEEG